MKTQVGIGAIPIDCFFVRIVISLKSSHSLPKAETKSHFTPF